MKPPTLHVLYCVVSHIIRINKSRHVTRRDLSDLISSCTGHVEPSAFMCRLSTRSITHLCWCNWRTFWRKNAAGRSPMRSSSCPTMPRLTGHLQPRRNWPTWASNVLITHPILRIWHRRTTTCTLDWKNNWNVAIFRPTRRSLLQQRPGWTDTLLFFF